METVFGWASENGSSAILIFVNTVVQILFLAVPTDIGGSTLWMNWLNLGIFLFCTLLVFGLKVEYNRRVCDEIGLESEQPHLDNTVDASGSGTLDALLNDPDHRPATIAAGCDHWGFI